MMTLALFNKLIRISPRQVPGTVPSAFHIFGHVTAHEVGMN